MKIACNPLINPFLQLKNKFGKSKKERSEVFGGFHKYGAD
jgi:hypothetical protein